MHVWFCLQFLVHLQKGQCESEPHQKNKKSTLNLVRTKASELADFPGLNTPLICMKRMHVSAKKNDSELITLGLG